MSVAIKHIQKGSAWEPSSQNCIIYKSTCNVSIYDAIVVYFYYEAVPVYLYKSTYTSTMRQYSCGHIDTSVEHRHFLGHFLNLSSILCKFFNLRQLSGTSRSNVYISLTLCSHYIFEIFIYFFLMYQRLF